MNNYVKKVLNILKYIFFLALGILVFWQVYKNENIDNYKTAFRNLNYSWIILSIFLSILSQLSRAARWNMLIQQLGYKPRLYNSFLSVMTLYFVNLIIPRAGEVFRCTLMSRYEKIPFTKLVGTVFVERIVDLITLIFLALVILGFQIRIFLQFANTHFDLTSTLSNVFSSRNIIVLSIGVFLLIVIIIVFYFYVKQRKNEKTITIIKRIRSIKNNIIEGIRSITKLHNKYLFIGHTMFIFLMWLLILYVIFLAFKPTSHLSILTGMVTFIMSGLAMLAPVQGGIGPWHFMVYETLFIYGIDKTDGKIFAFIAHGTTNLVYLFFGMIALVAIPLINNSVKNVKVMKQV